MSRLVLKFGGELLEDPGKLQTVVAAVASIVAAAGSTGVVIVHGGGREIDAALKVAGIEKRQVDGLRLTDPATLDVVVSVLAGAVNTRLVAALTAAGVRAAGLTGADGRCGLCEPAPPHTAVDGRLVDLGRVGQPVAQSGTELLDALTASGFVPVIACIGLGVDGRLYNVNADTLAGHIAARLRAGRLVIAGTTPGVLGEDGATVQTLDPPGIDAMVKRGTATAGMVAKLRACAHALAGGVDLVVIADGRDRAALERAAEGTTVPTATRVCSRRGSARR